MSHVTATVLSEYVPVTMLCSRLLGENTLVAKSIHITPNRCGKAASTSFLCF